MLYGTFDLCRGYCASLGQMALDCSEWGKHFDKTGCFEAGFQLFHRLMKKYPRAPFDISEVVVGKTVFPVTESVVYEKPFARLIHFEKEGCSQLPILILFAPLSGHYSSLLRRTVRTLLQDYDLYVTDWIDPRFIPLSEGRFDFFDFIKYSADFMTYFGKRVHILSVCQPAPACLAAAAYLAVNNHPCQPASLILMGGPIDISYQPTEVDRVATYIPFSFFEKLIEIVPEHYPGRFRRVYPGYMQHLSFVMMHPDNHIRQHLRFYEALCDGNDQFVERHRFFYDTYHSVMDMTEEFYLQTVQVVFKENCIGQNKLVIEGNRIPLEAIEKIPLLAIEGEFDDICSVGQTRAALDLCSSLPEKYKEYILVPGAGHYGVFSSRVWENSTYFKMHSFTQRVSSFSSS